jgi:hypothetical protein
LLLSGKWIRRDLVGSEKAIKKDHEEAGVVGLQTIGAPAQQACGSEFKSQCCQKKSAYERW